jgi:hypothetical protein
MRSNKTDSTKNETASAVERQSQGANQVTVIGRLVAAPTLCPRFLNLPTLDH